MGRFFIILGVVFVCVGLAMVFADRLGPLKDVFQRIPLGRLPGDISFGDENFRVSFPIVTCLVISAVLSLILWLFRK